MFAGVSDASIIGLKAQLVKRQHEAQRSGAVAFKKSRATFKSLEENLRSNPGVAERDRRDRLALKAFKVSGPVLLEGWVPLRLSYGH